MSKFYDLKADLPKSGQVFDFHQLEGKTVLIVNVASKCGLTPQYKGLEELYQKYKDKGFTILGFPCNQFGNQEPGTDEQVAEFCSLNYGVSFPLMKKSDVNGENTNETFKYLKAEKPEGDIKWNFAKFLISKDGTVVERFSPMATPESIDEHIAKLVA